MQKTIKTIAFSTIAMSQIFSAAAAADNEQPSKDHTTLLISTEQECVAYGPHRQNCDSPFLNLEFGAKRDIWTFSFAAENNNVTELTAGFEKHNLTLDIGLFDVEHPVTMHFNDGLNRSFAPITLDNSLAKQTIYDQIGIRLGYTHALSDRWSAAMNVTASQSRYMYMGHELSPNIRSRENILNLAHANDFYPMETIDALKNIGDIRDHVNINTSNTSLSALMNGQRPEINIDVDLDLPEISKRGQNFAVFATWLYMEHNHGWDKLRHSIDSKKLAEQYNDARSKIVDPVNDLSIPSDFTANITEALSQYLSPEKAGEIAAELGTDLQSALDKLKDNANGINTISAKQINQKIAEVITDLRGKLNAEIMQNPDKYYPAYRDTVEHIQALHKDYQTRSNTPSLHSTFELAYDGDALDWRVGAVWNKISSGALDSVDETRYGLYSITDWQISDKWAYQNVIAADYFENYLGIENLQNGHALFYNRLSYDVHRNVTAYVALGASAEAVDGAFATTEVGARGCWDFGAKKGQLCAQGAYETVESLDIIADQELDLGRVRDNGYKASLVYQLTF